MTDKLFLFTRYPQAGCAKTRLIPALGPEGAALLQRRMTEQTLDTARALQNEYPVNLEIRYAGGDLAMMKKWLGPDLDYCRQGNGDLGARLGRAFAEAFNSGYQRVLIIGADCPALSPQILAGGFAGLAEHDLVLGPAADGGYYLVGLARPCPQLFRNRPWGSDRLLHETLAAAEKNALSCHLLEELADVDRPEDLAHFSGYPDPE